MKRILTSIAGFFACRGSSRASTLPALDYDQMILLDAEDLAETGIRNAYERIKPALGKYIKSPEEIVERIDNDRPSYAISAAGQTYDIYGPELPEGAGESWGRATVALFDIVNNQLGNCPVLFYALNGGSELGGMFLTPDMADTAKRALEKKTDWPYLPVLDHPWYGQHH